MIFLALTEKWLSDALHFRAAPNWAIWCGSHAISADEFERLKLFGVTRLEYSPGASEGDSVARALAMVDQHHTGETVWVEGSPSGVTGCVQKV